MRLPVPPCTRVCIVLCVLTTTLGAHAQQDVAIPVGETRAQLTAAKGYTEEQIVDLYRRGQQRVYTGGARATLGMPCGGICAGQLYVLGDGSLGCWQIDGETYFSGYGATCYRTYRPARSIAQGFALAVHAADGSTTVATLADESYDAIEFVGEYPRALIHYRSQVKPVPPVQVDLEVFSPFIPLDARNSAWPATVLRFTIANPTEQPLDVALGGWLDNMVFSKHPQPLTIRHVNHRIQTDDLLSIHMTAVERRLPRVAAPQQRVLADFESGTYDGWTVSGTAFGEQPATGTHPNQQPVHGFSGKYLGNSYTEGDRPTGRLRSTPFSIDLPYLMFRIGGGDSAGKTCLNLIVDDKVVRSATGRNNEQLDLRTWDVRDLHGKTAELEIVDEETGGWGHVNVDDIALTSDVPAEFKEYDTAALDYGTMAFSLVGHGSAAPQWYGPERFLQELAAQSVPRPGIIERDFSEPVVATLRTDFTLQPGESHTATFLVTWYFPNLHTGHGRMYANWFTDAADVARQLAQDLDRLSADTRRFCDTYYRESGLPWWLNARLMMPVSNLATGTAQWWQDGRFWAWEGVGCCEGTCTHVWNYAQAHAWLFPELARSARTMQDLGEGFDEKTGLVGFRSNRVFAADGQAGTILKCYREHLIAPDATFLRQHWSAIKLALEYLIGQDANEDGIIDNDRQHNTYDINFVGPNTFVGALYLAALRAGEEMARAMDEPEAAARYRRIFESGQKWTAENLFNGEYFEQRVPPGDERPWQYGTGCLSDQLFGQTWAHMLGLGYLYPPDKVRSALAAVFKHNWMSDVGPFNATFPPERWFARPGDAGLFICTWPRGGRPKEPVRYRDEVWTGIEYQVAAGLIWEGYVDEGLLIVHGIDQRYDGPRHNPWNEVECGDHYARALASWDVLHALAGFYYNGPAERLTFTPRFRPDNFTSFFCVGSGWGTVAQERGPNVQVNVIEPTSGTLQLRRLTLATPEGAVARQADVSVRAAGKESAYRELTPELVANGSQCELRFAEPVELHPRERLQVEIHW